MWIGSRIRLTARQPYASPPGYQSPASGDNVPDPGSQDIIGAPPHHGSAPPTRYNNNDTLTNSAPYLSHSSAHQEDANASPVSQVVATTYINTQGKCQHRDFIEATKIYDMKWCGKWDEIHVIWMARSCHWSLGVMSLPFHLSPHWLQVTALYFFPLPALYFFACLLYVLSISLLPYADVLAISFLLSYIFLSLPVPRAMFMLFHCYPGLYSISCLVRCLSHFIPVQGNISLPA